MKTKTMNKIMNIIRFVVSGIAGCVTGCMIIMILDSVYRNTSAIDWLIDIYDGYFAVGVVYFVSLIVFNVLYRFIGKYKIVIVPKDKEVWTGPYTNND